MSRDPVEMEMLKARVKLLLDQPLFGQIILHLEMEDASDWCTTAATNGKKFYYNREFVKSLDFEELVFVHGHETLHVILDHIYRRGTRPKEYWGMACDFIANYILVKSKVGKMPSHALYNKHYTDDFSAEELCTLLEQTVTKVEVPMDMHLDVGQGNDADNDDSGSGLPSSGPARLSPAEVREVRDTMRAALLQAAQNTPPGKMPAGIRRLLDKLIAPKINWRHILISNMRSMIKYDYTYTRLSRRSWSSGLILPGQDVQDRITATAWLDGSGSTTQKMVSDFLSECKGIMGTFHDFELTIGTFDTNVYNIRVFTPDNAREIDKYEFKGGGGTMPSCCWDYMKSHRLKPNKVLVFTDGEVRTNWGDPNYADTIFIIHSNPDIKAPYGRTILYEP
jgi:predicted metal-dependent peptidase